MDELQNDTVDTQETDQDQQPKPKPKSQADIFLESLKKKQTAPVQSTSMADQFLNSVKKKGNEAAGSLGGQVGGAASSSTGSDPLANQKKVFPGLSKTPIVKGETPEPETLLPVSKKPVNKIKEFTQDYISAVPNTIKLTTPEGADFTIDSNHPEFQNPQYVSALQDRVNNKDVTDVDIATLSKGTGKTPQAIDAYVKGDNAKGEAFDTVDVLTKTNEELVNTINHYNADYGGGQFGKQYNPEEILQSPDKTAEFLQEYEKKTGERAAQIFAKEAAKKQAEAQKMGYEDFDVTDIRNMALESTKDELDNVRRLFEVRKQMLQKQIIEKTAQEGIEKAESRDVTADKIAKRLDPVGYANAKKALKYQGGVDDLTEKSSVFDVVGALTDEIKGGNQFKDQVLNSVIGDADIALNNSYAKMANDKAALAKINGDENLMTEAKLLYSKVDKNILDKYPVKQMQQMANEIASDIATEAGQLVGTETQDYGLKIAGFTPEKIAEIVQQKGWLNDPKKKALAMQLIENPKLIKDASYFGGAKSSFLQPFIDLGLSAMDVTGVRSFKDIYSDKVKGDLFPAEFNPDQIKPDFEIYKGDNPVYQFHTRNTINGISNLAGLTAGAMLTEGISTGVGASVATARRLSAYVTFGIPSIDANLKDSYNFIDNDAERAAYVTLGALINGEGGQLLDLGKISRVPGLKEDFKALSKNLIEKNLTTEAKDELLNNAKNKYVDFVVKYGKIGGNIVKGTTKGAATMSYFTFANQYNKLLNGDPNTKAADLLPDAGHAFVDGIFTMIPFGFVGGVKMAKNENSTYKEMINKFATMPDAAQDVIRMGAKSEQDFNYKMSVINTAKAAKNALDATEKETGIDLAPTQRSVYVANKTIEASLRDKAAKTVDENTKEKLLVDADKLNEQSTQTLDGLKFSATLEPLYDLYHAEKNYNAEYQNFHEGNAVDDKALLEAKDKYEKLQYKYFENPAATPEQEIFKINGNDASKKEVQDILAKGQQESDKYDIKYTGNDAELHKQIQQFGGTTSDEGTLTHSPKSREALLEESAPVLFDKVAGKLPAIYNDPNNKIPIVNELTNQGLTNPTGLKSTFKGDEEQALEFVSRNTVTDINDSIESWKGIRDKEGTEPAEKDLAREQISLLKKGLKAKGEIHKEEADQQDAALNPKATVESAVIEIGGKTYEGKNHAEAILRAKEDGQDISQVDRKGQGKFKLSDGTVIDRSEAKKRFKADKAEQLIEQDETSIQANKNYNPAPKNKAERLAAFKKNYVEPTQPTATEQKQWNDLSMQEKLALAKDNLPQVETLSNVDAIKVADQNAKMLLGKLNKQPEVTTPAVEQTNTTEVVATTPTEVSGKDGVVDFTANGGNKVVDVKGEPIVVYHGTQNKGKDFIPEIINYEDEVGAHFGTEEQAGNAIKRQQEEGSDKESGNVIPFQINIKNPLRVPDIGRWYPNKIFDEIIEPSNMKYEKSDFYGKSAEDIIQIFKDNGYDGLVYENKHEGKGDSYIVFDKSQIKPQLKSDKNVKNTGISQDNNKVLESSREQSLSTPKGKEVVQPSNVGGEGVKEEKAFTKNALDRADAKKIFAEVRKVDEPADAEQAALEYIANNGGISAQAIDEVAGTVKRASLNTGARENLSQEVKSRDYYAPNAKGGIDQVAHDLWEKYGQRIPETEIKDALMNVIRTHNTRLEAGKAYLEQYSPEYVEKKQQEKFYQEHLKEIADVEKAMEEYFNIEVEAEFEAMQDENYVTNLIEKYESEIKGENQQSPTETESGIDKGTGDQRSADEAEIRKAIEDAAASKKSIKAKNDAMEAEAAKHGELGAKVLKDINDGNEPPNADASNEDNGGEDYTGVRKEKLREIQGAKELFQKREKKTWTEIYDSALRNIQKMYPNKSLYDGMKTRVRELVRKVDEKQLYNPTSEDIAVFNVLRAETHKRIDAVEGLDSENSIVRQTAIEELSNLNNDLFDIAKATNPDGEAGRAFGMLQSEVNANNGLKIRRMELMKANGGEPLTEADNKWAEEKWNEEKDLMKQEEEIRSQSMQQDFDNRIAELQKDYEEKLKQAGAKGKPTKEQTLNQKGDKSLADKIRKLKLTGTKVDFTFGTWNLAVEAVAKLVEAGKSIKEAIQKIIDDKEVGFKTDKDREDFEALFAEKLTKPTPEETLSKIKEFAKENDVTDVTTDMVSKNLIRDYVDSHIGEVEQKDLLDKAFKDLKKELPDLSKEKLIEAYLKENEFKQPTKKDIEGGLADAKKQLKNISKLTEDIEDLSGLKEIRQRSFPTERAKSEHEQKLFDEKNAKLKEISDRNNKIKEENAKLETERNRQLKKVSELQDKKAKLLSGIKEATEVRDRKLDTPEIEDLRNQVKQIEKDIREAEAEQKAAERKVISDRNKSINKDNRMIEAEAIRQVTKVQDLQAKKEQLENGIREKHDKITKVDTPEIEAMKQAVKDADANLRVAESEAKRMSKEIQDRKDKIAELDANIIRAKNDRDLIKIHRNKSEREIDEEIADKERELKKAIRDNSSDERVQAQKLEDAKENTVKKTEEFKRRLAEGDFEDPIPVKLKKEDAELIKLKKEQSIVEEAFRKKQRELQEKNKHWAERMGDTLRSAYVALLIGAPKTLAKVASMSIMRPVSEATSKLTFGKVFDAIFPKISEVAKRGGESSSLRSIQKGFEAYFRQMGERKMEAIYDKASNEFDAAAKAYRDYKNSGNVDAKKLKELQTDMNNKLMKAQSSFIYKFIGGSSIKDAWQSFVFRSNEIEKQFGKVEGEHFKDGNWLDKINYVMGFIGRSHSAAKTFSGRFSFAAGFMARLEGAVEAGVDISNGDRILEIAHESYLDWERGKYQQYNAVTEWWNKKFDTKDETPTGKAMDALLKSEVAITRVPVNILHEQVMEYTLGAFRALSATVKVNREAREQLKQSGITAETLSKEEFSDALKQQIGQMDEKQAATIARCFRKGGLGAGLYAFALISGAIHFGIFPYLGQKKKKDEEKLAKDELNPDQVEIFGHKFGELSSSLISHVPAFYPMGMGLGMAQAYRDQIKKGKSTGQAVAASLYTHLKIVEGGIPQFKLVQPLQEESVRLIKKRLVSTGLMSDDKTNYTSEQLKNPVFNKMHDKGVKMPVYDPIKIQTKEVNGKATEHLSDYDEKTQKEYIQKADKYYEEELKKLQSGKTQVWVNADGTASTPTTSTGKKGKKLVKFDNLTDEQVNNVVHGSGGIVTEVTEKVKKEVLKNKKPIKKD